MGNCICKGGKSSRKLARDLNYINKEENLKSFQFTEELEPLDLMPYKTGSQLPEVSYVMQANSGQEITPNGQQIRKLSEHRPDFSKDEFETPFTSNSPCNSCVHLQEKICELLQHYNIHNETMQCNSFHNRSPYNHERVNSGDSPCITTAKNGNSEMNSISSAYQYQEGPGTSWQFGHHYFEETSDSDDKKDSPKEIIPNTNSWKLPFNNFLCNGNSGISIGGLGCELSLGLSVFGNKIL